MIEYIEKEKDKKIRNSLMKELRKSFFIFLKFENAKFSKYEKLKKEYFIIYSLQLYNSEILLEFF